MGKNKNKNVVKRALNGTTLGKSMEKYLNDESSIVRGIIGKDDQETLKLLEDTRDLELTRDELETASRVLLSTFEFQNPNKWASVGKFLDHLYECSMTVQGFSSIVNQICEDIKMEGFCETHATGIVQVTCAWIIVRATLDTIFGELELARKHTNQPKVVMIPEKEKKPDNAKVVMDDDNTYVLNAKEEARARDLGLPVEYHILDMNKFYQAEMDAAVDWKTTHGVYAPAYQIYGMPRKEYNAWRKEICDFVSGLESDSDEFVASSNIGNDNGEKPTRRIEKKPEEIKKPKKFDLMVIVDSADQYRKEIESDPKAAKRIVDAIISDEKVKEYLASVKEQYYDVMKLKLQQTFHILYGAKELDTETAVTAAVLIARRYGISEEDAAVFTIPALSNDGDLMAEFALELLKPENLKVLRKGIIDNNIVVPQTLRDIVHDWTRENSNERPTKLSNLSSVGVEGLTAATRKLFDSMLHVG